MRAAKCILGFSIRLSAQCALSFHICNLCYSLVLIVLPAISHKADVFFQDFPEIHIICYFWPPTNLSTGDFPLVENLPFLQLLACFKGHCLL